MIQITMPRLSDTMSEGAISTWFKKPGDQVDVGDLLVEIETDKTTMEVEAYDAGRLTAILHPEGAVVPIGAPIAELDGAEVPTPGPAEPAPVPTSTASTTEDAPAKTRVVDHAVEPRPDGERVLATPLVRSIAREHDIDLRTVTGSGPGGRITKVDLTGLLDTGAPSRTGPTTPAVAVPDPAPRPAQGSGDTDRRDPQEVPLSQVRRVIARRLAESSRSIPHFTVTAVADVEELTSLRAQLNARLAASGRGKVSVNDLVVRATGLALRRHPDVNASYRGDDATTSYIHRRVNIGVAVASPHGLVVPVIEDVDLKTVTQLGIETKRLVTLADDRALTPAQMSGGTFTISNLGMFGVEEFTAIINPPEAAILAVGATRREAAIVGDEVTARHRMRLTLSADHRIIDGALAAQFLQTLTGLLKDPWTVLA
ncbi:dihydrolipoamide acetyltransferase family protein [Promicromonospora iranensis]|uniref:dihydrolipoamide acetyltransferase family protein n=1 Tax=Promicromonospora iranensis TaxID=1105144 RepID=UPI0023A93D2C|nr:dihydrolipoamide acetyltransferase family protein [Promicromonospora iranensis]